MAFARSSVGREWALIRVDGQARCADTPDQCHPRRLMAESVLSEAAGARQRVPRALPVLTAEPDASAADIVLALDGDDLGNRPRGPRRRSYPAARARSKSFTPGATFRDPVATSTCFLPRKQRDYPAKPIRRLKGSNENKLLAVDRLVVASGDPLARRPKKTRTRQRRRSGRLARRSRRQNVDILGEARSRDRGVPRLRGRPERLRMVGPVSVLTPS